MSHCEICNVRTIHLIVANSGIEVCGLDCLANTNQKRFTREEALNRAYVRYPQAVSIILEIDAELFKHSYDVQYFITAFIYFRADSVNPDATMRFCWDVEEVDGDQASHLGKLSMRRELNEVAA